jgi:type II secretory pathway pseudopilin PulG
MLAPCSRQQGTVLLTVLFMVVLLGLAASLAGQTLQAYVQREREEELLWRGQQYRRAITSFANVQGGRVFPASLEDLLRDPRSPSVVRHLRRLYNDPMTGQPWELVKDPAGRIIGVRSTSTLQPFRQEGFPRELDDLKQKNSYQEWKFVYATPQQKAAQPSSGRVSTPVRPGISSPSDKD